MPQIICVHVRIDCGKRGIRLSRIRNVEEKEEEWTLRCTNKTGLKAKIKWLDLREVIDEGGAIKK